MSFSNSTTTHEAILEASKQHDSFYLYGAREISQAAQQLCTHFPSVTFLYSLKNNPCNQVLQALLPHGFGTDAASLSEVLQSVAAGITKEKAQYSAPGKTAHDIATALPVATLVADSLNEVARINDIAAEQGVIAEIGVRIHPSFSFDDAAPAPSKFGIEEAQAFAALPTWRNLSNIRIVGLHIHCRSQSLNANYLKRYHANVLDCANRFVDALGTPLTFVNMGAGLGIPYAPADDALDLAAIASETNAHLAAFHAAHPNTKVYIETGRFCVGNNGVYVSKVLDKKTCGDTTFVILANTLNGFIRPCLANVLEAANPQPSAAEPLYTTQNAFGLFTLTQNDDIFAKATDTSPTISDTKTSEPTKNTDTSDSAPTTETVTLVGNLCTATDTLAKEITLPHLSCGDVIVATNAGSYAAVLSPMQFSHQVPPAQLILQADGTIISAL